MKILVTVKRVTDYERKVKIKPDGSGFETEGMNFVPNPFDEIAVEEALRLTKEHGGDVVVVSIGPNDATQQIRQALAMGAQRGILVQAGELDSDAVARVLQKLVEKENPDLVLMGKQATDDDANQAGQLLAGYLGWPQATFASKTEGLESAEEKAQKPGVKVADGWASVAREADGGIETIKVQLPAVITTDLRLNHPRFASLPGIMKAKKKPIEEIPVASLGVDITPKVRVLKYEEPPARLAGVKVADVDELVNKLKNEAKVI
ncbi:MAG: electron transfer flavoprotein subunit beta/FixA family protein [Myxococcales bacterium]|nr:electron transfer flavoprotein subunit beta/FixA family protein [Myxococcales bacterium]MCB9646926.1 electron transfer flavoprotein subunit beta/FixA family protein [Deltaproteobacteria bacterium]